MKKNDVTKELEEKISTKDDEIKELQKISFDDEIKELQKISFDDEIKGLEQKRNILFKQIREDEEEMKGLQKLESKVNKGLMDSIECPKCNHEFSVMNKKLNIKKAREKHQDIKDAISDIKKDISRTTSDWNNKKFSIAGVESDKRENEKKIHDFLIKQKEIDLKIKNIEAEKQNLEFKISSRFDNMKRSNALRKENIDKIQEILNQEIEDPTVEFKKKLKTLEMKKDNVSIERSKIEVDIKGNNEIKETFIKFKTHLSNKAIGVIEANANDYLEHTKTNLSIQLDGYKMTRTKKIKENISATILKDGKPATGYGLLSSGEKAKIEISVIMALQKIINNSTDYGKGLDLCFLDEIIESVDELGIEGIMNSLNLLNQTIIVITHGTFNKVYPHIVSVIKENNESKINYEQ